MYILRHGIKKDLPRQWALPDRIFFGHGACHILAGAFLDDPPVSGFYGERIIPVDGLAGSHVYVTDGAIVFDYHGYSSRDSILAHHARGWGTRYPEWDCDVVRVDFDLLNTEQLNQRKMRGALQYLHDAVPRARGFIESINHGRGIARARATLTR